MDKFYLKIFVIIFSLCCSSPIMAEEESYDFTTSIDAGISKKFFKRLRVGLTESVSLKENSTTLDKLSTKADVSYAVVRKVLRVGVSYYAIAKNRQAKSQRHDLRGKAYGADREGKEERTKTAHRPVSGAVDTGREGTDRRQGSPI